MTLSEAYITNLVNQRIPMIKDWTDSMGISIENNTEFENSNDNTISSQISGYTLFDKLSRGYIAHKQTSLDYSDETHYLLGMYLRALKELENLDYMHLYNCVQSVQTVGANKIWHVPIIWGRVYSISVNTIYNSKLRFIYSNTNEDIIDSIVLPTVKSGVPVIIDTSKLTATINQNLIEFVEFEITTTSKAKLAVIEGNFEILTRVTEDFSISTPSVLQNYSRFSPKLMELLLGTAITEKSNPEIKKLAIQKYGKLENICYSQLKDTYKYDLDSYIDKRVKI